MALDEFDRQLIAATQSGLPLLPRPYEAVGAMLGVSGEAVRERLAQMQASGLIRRIGAVPNHYKLGYTANGMTVWDVDDARVDELGTRVGALPGVSHCYRRPRELPRWPRFGLGLPGFFTGTPPRTRPRQCSPDDAGAARDDRCASPERRERPNGLAQRLA